LPPEADGKGNYGLNPTQKLMIEKGYAVKQSHEGFGLQTARVVNMGWPNPSGLA
ncbi:hypothetical protein HAX54_019424, partial [Datura stramonium]|nr:hypothetical protein [Datura stramonium]